MINGFGRCRALHRVEIPALVEEIGLSAFTKCTRLTEVTLAGDRDLRVVEGFKRCTSMDLVEIPGSVDEIGSKAFSGCRSLKGGIFAVGR
jgi:hypothetical protein